VSGSVNKVILVGNVGRDPEIRTLNSGDRVANLSLATSETWRAKDGERKERSTWHAVVCFNDNLTKVIEAYVRKGSKIYVSGSLQTRKYEQNGVEKFVTEVVMQRFGGELVLLDSKGGGEEPRAETHKGGPKESFDLDDEIPF
jgi:single-strand DNA-binding protein